MIFKKKITKNTGNDLPWWD